MRITFYGGARQVTGSMFLLELENDFNLLVECGLDLKRKTEESSQESDESDNRPPWEKEIPINSAFPFEASRINAVLLTHAHIDHSGNLPNLVREGFEGRIYCTPPTSALSQILIMDSAQLNRKKLNRLKSSSGKNTRNKDLKIPADWYLEPQAEESFSYFSTIGFGQRFRVTKGVHVTFYQASHLLGAASILVEVEENGETKKIGFSGDLGRLDYPLLNNPDPFPEVDYLISESTYGNRFHEDKEEPIDLLEAIIREACVEKPGRLIIPSFSVGRTQALLFTLNRLYSERDIPPLKVFTDSPLALQSTKIHEKYSQYLNGEAQAFIKSNGELFDFSNLVYVENSKDSRALKDYTQPCIIISSSGMVSGGRVQYHVQTNLSNPYATILMIGYAAEGTIGWDLLHAEGSVRIEGRDIPKAATIKKIDVFSGHADLDGLLSFIQRQKKERLKKIFLVHGDFETMLDFRDTLFEKGYDQTVIPEKGETFNL